MKVVSVSVEPEVTVLPKTCRMVGVGHPARSSARRGPPCRRMPTAPLPPTRPSWSCGSKVTLTLGEVADAIRERLIALAVGTGLQVLQAMLAEDVARLVGPRATIPTALPCGRPNQPAIARALFIKEKTASVTSPAS